MRLAPPHPDPKTRPCRHGCCSWHWSRCRRRLSASNAAVPAKRTIAPRWRGVRCCTRSHAIENRRGEGLNSWVDVARTCGRARLCKRHQLQVCLPHPRATQCAASCSARACKHTVCFRWCMLLACGHRCGLHADCAPPPAHFAVHRGLQNADQTAGVLPAARTAASSPRQVACSSCLRSARGPPVRAAAPRCAKSSERCGSHRAELRRCRRCPQSLKPQPRSLPTRKHWDLTEVLLAGNHTETSFAAKRATDSHLILQRHARGPAVAAAPVGRP